MSVVRTDKWLSNSYDHPIEICEKIRKRFDGAEAHEIYRYLKIHGMYRPLKDGEHVVEQLKENRVWDIVQREKQRLQSLWDGPNVPIYIFPSDSTNKQLKREFNGKSGLAFKDKLFLFVSEENKADEIRALFTHEYNHACRLAKYPKKEEEYTLLDTIILEGMAENAVRERCGEPFVSAWTSYYPADQLEKMWRRVVQPNKDIPKNHPKHQDILYGLRFYPKMAGYCSGYHLVKKYSESTGSKSKDLLSIPSEEIADMKK